MKLKWHIKEYEVALCGKKVKNLLAPEEFKLCLENEKCKICEKIMNGLTYYEHAVEN